MNGDGRLLYLVRHGKAEAGHDDDLRRLTEGGRKTVRRVAGRLADAGVRPDRIEHSGLVRARETAEILAGALGSTPEAVAGLRPEADVAPIARRLLGSPARRIMLVGHLPFMARLTCYLLTGDADSDLIHLRTGAVVCLSHEGAWLLEWLLSPDLV